VSHAIVLVVTKRVFRPWLTRRRSRGSRSAWRSASGRSPRSARAQRRAFSPLASWKTRHARRPPPETCPVSTGRGTRRVQSVREGGGWVGVPGARRPPPGWPAARLGGPLERRRVALARAHAARLSTFDMKWLARRAGQVGALNVELGAATRECGLLDQEAKDARTDCKRVRFLFCPCCGVRAAAGVRHAAFWRSWCAACGAWPGARNAVFVSHSGRLADPGAARARCAAGQGAARARGGPARGARARGRAALARRARRGHGAARGGGGGAAPPPSPY
jgi:hypothetical protein